MIPFNKPCVTENSKKCVRQAMEKDYLSGDGYFSQKCCKWFEEELKLNKVFLTTSCTHSLEMAAMLIDVQPGDEIIMPSYTFVSTANAFVLRGAKIVFVDIRPDTMNIDETKIEAAITRKTKAIVPVHYAGVGCEMGFIMAIADKYHLFVIEDAAQGMMSLYKRRPLGSIGHFGAYSFHETKNYTSGGEGGLLIVNDERFADRAEIIREKGTNRRQFYRGEIDKYTWCDLGSSYLPSELQAAYLYGQLELAEEIKNFRIRRWNLYMEFLTPLSQKGLITLPYVPDICSHNAHIFSIKVKNKIVRNELLSFLHARGIRAVFHYIPLHSAKAGKLYSYFHHEDIFTTKESERLIRLPLWYGIEKYEIKLVSEQVIQYFL